MSKNTKGNDGGNESWNRVDPSAASDGDIQRVHDDLVDKKETPREGYSFIPIFLVFLISILIVFSGIYMVWRSDDFDQMGYDESRRRFEWEETEAPAAVDPVLQAGQQVYAQCSACHQQEGQGLPGSFPPLDTTRWVVGDEDRLIRIVMHGLSGEIEVKGENYSGVMPNLGLGDEDIASVLTYIRQAWNNDASAVAVEDVARVREEVGERGPWNADELLAEFPLEDPAELEAAAEEEATEDEPADEEPAEEM